MAREVWFIGFEIVFGMGCILLIIDGAMRLHFAAKLAKSNTQAQSGKKGLK